MKYTVFHIQTGGLDPEKHSLLELGVMVENTKCKLSFQDTPKYHVLVHHDIYNIEPYAGYANKEVFRQMILPERERTMRMVNYDDLAFNFLKWVSKVTGQNNKNDKFPGNTLPERTLAELPNQPILLNVAGKNFGSFHLGFLKKIPRFDSFIKFNHRILDPSILYLDLNTDEDLPSGDECRKRAGIKIENINTGNTLSECWDTIQLLRNKLNY